MTWNSAPEFVSLLFTIILMVNVLKDKSVPTFRNILFHWIVKVAFVAIVISLCNLYVVIYSQSIANWIVHSSNIVFYIITPLMMVLITYYVFAFLYEGQKDTTHYLKRLSLPFLGYVFLVLLNPWHQWFSYIDFSGQYQLGEYIILIHVIAYVYFALMIIGIYHFRSQLDRQTIRVLLSFPLLITALIFIQQLFPSLILSGTAITATILIIYLYFQRRERMSDELTHLFNRRAFVQHIQQYIKNEDAFFVIYINIIDFKTINDRFGEQNGDQILRGIADYLKLKFKPENIYRTGGDEFAIICHKYTLKTIKSDINEIFLRFEKPWTSHVLPSTVLASHSVIGYPDHIQTWEDMIELIDFCNQQANQMSGRKIYYASSTSYEEIVKKRLITQLIDKGIQEDLFEVVYQPIYDVKNNRYNQCEALLRLEDPHYGNIAPNDFIPIAEETGAIIELTKIVLHQVCHFIKKADQININLDSVSINLSSTQLSQVNINRSILRMIRQHQVDPKRIVFEITEGAFISNKDRTLMLMFQLNRYGIKFFLDDFGTGFSNLSSMMGLPFSTIKIDRTLLVNALSNNRNRKILEGICHAFFEVGFNIVIEGVEDEKGYEIAIQTMATHIQGFYYAKPMRESQVLNMLRLQDHDE